MVVKSNVSFLYNTNSNSKTAFDCFYAHIIDNREWRAQNVSRADYLTPYCRRPSSNDSIGNIQGYVQSTETLKSLRSKGISSEDLLQSSMALDVIEQYAIYLIRAGTGPVNRTGPDRIRNSTGRKKTGNSPVELLKKMYSFCYFFLSKTVL